MEVGGLRVGDSVEALLVGERLRASGNVSSAVHSCGGLLQVALGDELCSKGVQVSGGRNV